MLVLVFDMDGVLFDTERVKMAAFRDAFAPLCGEDVVLDQIAVYNATNRGIPRAVKIRHVLETIVLASMGTDAAEDAVSDRYAELLRQRLPECVPLPGVRAFLQAVPAIRYVASSAPIGEVTTQLDRHGLTGSFADVFGHPTSKIEALRAVTERHPGSIRAFFGDAPADLAAAQVTDTPFVAINANPDLATAVKDGFDDFIHGDAIFARIHAGGGATIHGQRTP